jgi:hypothetical protein
MRIQAGGIVLVSVAAIGACNPDGGDGPKVHINSAPVADAGPDIDQSADSAVTLDGSGSFDPDGQRITFVWSFDRVPDGSVVDQKEAPFSTNHDTSSSTTFRPDKAGTYIVKLVVNDGKIESNEDYAIINIEAGEIPVADAGPDAEGTTGETFTMDGTGSTDPLGRDLSYAWSFASVPTSSGLAALDNASTVAPSFTADVGGVYVVALVVSNGVSQSETDTAIIKVSSATPLPPISDAGDDITDAQDCTAISLDGSGYDPNGDEMKYLWSLQVKPEGSNASDSDIADRTAATTTFWPDAAGTYRLQLTVSDGEDWSTPDEVQIDAAERSYNTAPVVTQGENPRTLDGGSTVCEEDGYVYDCEECDPANVPLGDDWSVVDADGDPINITWEITSGTATIDDATELSTSAMLSGALPVEPDACEINEYVFTLTATDCVGDSDVETMTYNVSCCGLTDTAGKK